MVSRSAFLARKLLFGFLYLAALAIAGVLLYQTLKVAEQRPDIMIIPGVAPTPPSAATGTPAVIQVGAGTLTQLPSPVPLATVPPIESVDGTAALTQTGYHPKSGRYVAAWFPPSFSGGARDSFEANKDIIDELSPFWYSTDASGRLYGNWDEELVQVSHASNVMVIPALHNISSFDVVIGVLSDPYIRARHVQNIVDEVLARNYDGIDIDYEALPANMRPAFSAFIIELSAALHAHGKILTVAVHAKDCDYCGLGGFQDWSVIGQHADRVRSMTYDYSWRGSGPGPVAPLYWVESVAQYARSIVDPAKVFIGVPFYGYDWPQGGTATGLPWSDIEALIEERDLAVNLLQRDERGRVDESWFRYETENGYREVWYMNPGGLESKLELVRRLDLAGIAIWRIGYEKPEYWDVIRKNLVEDPVLIQREINPLLPEH